LREDRLALGGDADDLVERALGHAVGLRRAEMDHASLDLLDLHVGPLEGVGRLAGAEPDRVRRRRRGDEQRGARAGNPADNKL